MTLRGGSILHKLLLKGFQAYFVGGCVRDTLLGREPKDIDIATDALPDQVEALFEKTIPTGKDYGTITVMEDGEAFEVTTFRLESDYDGRRPKTVAFAKELKDDLQRRDFTINAMAMNLEGHVIDYFDGAKDLEKGILRFVGSPSERIREDKIRILRYVRFMCEYNLKDPVYSEMELAALNQVNISNLSAERIREEFNKIILSPFPEKGLRKLDDLGLLVQFFPELTNCKGFLQHHPAHSDDVFEHTLKVFKNACELWPYTKNIADGTEFKDRHVILQLRLSALCHDLGKVHTLTFDSEGVGHFYGHQKVSAEYTVQFMKRLKYANREIETVELLVFQHMRMYESLTRASARRLLSKIGESHLELFFMLQRADTSACLGNRVEHLYQIDTMEGLCNEILKENLAFSLKDLKINGKDLLNIGMEGPVIGETLKKVLEAVISETIENEREILMDFVKGLG